MPKVQCLVVLRFTRARRAVEAPTNLDLSLAALPAAAEWGVRTRRSSIVLSACPMAGRMSVSVFTTPLYEPTSCGFLEFCPSFVDQWLDNFKRGGVDFYEGADPIFFVTDDHRFGTPVVSELFVHSKSPACDVRSLWAHYQAYSAGGRHRGAQGFVAVRAHLRPHPRLQGSSCGAAGAHQHRQC